MIKCKTNGTFRIGQQIMICSAIKSGDESLCESTSYCKHQVHITEEKKEDVVMGMSKQILSMAIGIIIGVVTCLIILPQKTQEGCELGWSEEQLEMITNKYFEKYYD